MSLLDVLTSIAPGFAGAFLSRGQSRWSRAAAARDKAREQLAEIVRWRWWRNPASQEDREDRFGAQLYDERLRAYLRAAGVPQQLISRLQDELDSFRWHISVEPGDGDDEVPWIEKKYIHRLDEVVEEVHTWLDAADRRPWGSRPALTRSRGSNENKKAAKGALT